MKEKSRKEQKEQGKNHSQVPLVKWEPGYDSKHGRYEDNAVIETAKGRYHIYGTERYPDRYIGPFSYDIRKELDNDKEEKISYLRDYEYQRGSIRYRSDFKDWFADYILKIEELREGEMKGVFVYRISPETIMGEKKRVVALRDIEESAWFVILADANNVEKWLNLSGKWFLYGDMLGRFTGGEDLMMEEVSECLKAHTSLVRIFPETTETSASHSIPEFTETLGLRSRWIQWKETRKLQNYLRQKQNGNSGK